MSSNTPEFTVSELAQSLKRTVEQTYGHVRVRGELGRVTTAKSGHCYLDVKDDRAVINSIIWKGVMSRLPMHPEEGMEVICEGKLSTYPGRSNYQLIIDKMELAGAGALMALFEKRKKMLAKEGLFDEKHKKILPTLPKHIGVVTSPTGAAIQDILNVLDRRYKGAQVTVIPARVQGDGAAQEVVRGIDLANQLDIFDVLIVGRGGGSIEDLWCFNEEIVARSIFVQFASLYATSSTVTHVKLGLEFAPKLAFGILLLLPLAMFNSYKTPLLWHCISVIDVFALISNVSI